MASFITEQGEMADLIRSYDWSKTPVGPPEQWPQSLKTALSICLGSKFPMFVWWGKKLTVFYNDAYIPFTGLKHPTYLGRTAQEQWAEIWSALQPLTDQVMQTGVATWAENMQLFMTRKGFLEETYFTFSYSPIRDESGDVGGIINPCQENTSAVLSRRRISLMQELGLFEVETLPDLSAKVIQVLSTNEHDIPFALLYLADEERKATKLTGYFGIAENSVLAPKTISLANRSVWPMTEIYEHRKATLITKLRENHLAELPEHPYPEKPDAAYVLPLILPNQEKPLGFVVLGISSRLEFDQQYKTFFNLIAERISTHVAGLHALEFEKKRVAALNEIDQAKTAFFSNVSHEFRTPLTLLLAPLEEILSGQMGSINSEVINSVEIIQRNALRLLKLVNSLLDFSRLEANRMQAQYEEIDIATFTKEIVSSFQSIVESANLKFTVKISPVSEKVYVDRDMWEKIVLNLLSNAFKYTFIGEIAVETKVQDGKFQLSVRDTGTGIPEEELSKIFERFHRVPGSSGRTHEGTGIGLALVKELVKLHGGTIGVTSELKKGSVFTVTIPTGSSHLATNVVSKNKTLDTTENIRAKSFVSESSNWLEKKTSTTSVADGKNKKLILLADDNPDMRNYITKLLSDYYHVVAVSNGKQALKAAQQMTPDLVLTDIMMPEMDGTELLEKLRLDSTLKTVPVVLLSARAGEEAKTSGISLGADDYLTKPFSAKELLARINTQLQMTDVRKKAIQQETLVSELHSLIEARDEFLSVAAHELRTPIGILKMQLQITDRQMRKVYNDDPVAAPFFRAHELCQRQANNLMSLIEELLDVSRIRLDRMDLNYALFDFSQLITDIVTEFKPQFQAAGNIVKTQIEENLKGDWDEVRLRQAITNLLANAIRHAPGAPLDISLKAINNNKIRFIVSDQGPGIDPDKKDRIFERFERGVSTRNVGGLGLGLFITKGIIEAHHGTITLGTSTPHGAQFIVELPRNQTVH